MGARAIYKPMPEIPEELRDHPMTLVAMARFHVGVDGAATVDLMQPTANPLLNTALLTALKTWRFFPAMANGRPVASTIDIRIPLAVQ
jgi:protein TonB